MSPADRSQGRDPEPTAGDRRPASAATSAAPPARKPYRAPRLGVYGRLTELTEFGGSQLVDSGNNLGNLQ